ncbi:MAG: hypothetical protein OEZ58_23545, partial [Gammaproteobacteria bacterium]|nr:hypothetical protein [Gammaproteobacteria bacterium]
MAFIYERNPLKSRFQMEKMGVLGSVCSAFSVLMKVHVVELGMLLITFSLRGLQLNKVKVKIKVIVLVVLFFVCVSAAYSSEFELGVGIAAVENYNGVSPALGLAYQLTHLDRINLKVVGSYWLGEDQNLLQYEK